MEFTKMHGAGNDFVLLKHQGDNVDYGMLAVKLCHRRFSVGGDGLMVAVPSEQADVKMLYYNSDGSAAAMCGNGIRCFSKFVYEEGIVESTEFTVETLGGIKTIFLKLELGIVTQVEVDMGKASFKPSAVPVISDALEYVNETMVFEDQSIKLSSVLMGVPHTVVFVEDIRHSGLLTLGPLIEKAKQYPEGTNVNFVEIRNRTSIIVDTWERGSGHTWACGTGCCASVVIAHHLGYVDDVVKVSVPGGELIVRIDNNGVVWMKGPAVTVAKGQLIMK